MTWSCARERVGKAAKPRFVSRLEVTGIQAASYSMQLDWKGGASVWQHVQRRYDLLSTGEEWGTVRP